LCAIMEWGFPPEFGGAGTGCSPLWVDVSKNSQLKLRLRNVRR
jgi:hypothetical protein